MPNLDTSEPTPGPGRAGKPRRFGWQVRLLFGLLRLALTVGVAAAVALAVSIWGPAVLGLRQPEAQRADALAAQVTTRLERLESDLAGLRERIARLESTLADTGLQVSPGPPLADRVGELERQLALLTGRQETAAGVASRLRLLSLLSRASGELLKIRLDVVARNEGKAIEEARSLIALLQEAAVQAEPGPGAALGRLADSVQQARTALVLADGSGPDRLELIWHELSNLIGGLAGVAAASEP